MKLQAIAILTFLIFENVMAQETTTTKYINSTDMEALKLTQEWDKTFPQSDKVEHTKSRFTTVTALRLPQTFTSRKIRKDVWQPLPSVALTVR